MKKKIPKFKSETEAQLFWQQHDSSDYIDWSDAQEVVFFSFETYNQDNFDSLSRVKD